MNAPKKMELSPAWQAAIAETVRVAVGEAVCEALRQHAPALAAVDRVLRIGDVMSATGLSKSSIYVMQKAGTFPQGFSLGANSTGWMESDVQAWIAARAASKKEA